MADIKSDVIDYVKDTALDLYSKIQNIHIRKNIDTRFDIVSSGKSIYNVQYNKQNQISLLKLLAILGTVFISVSFIFCFFKKCFKCKVIKQYKKQLKAKETKEASV